MTPAITAITATMPGREEVLAEACASVESQIYPVVDHLIRCESPGPYGPNPYHLATQHNALLSVVNTEWLAIIDDDNIWFRNYLKTIVRAIDAHPPGSLDVVYTWAEGPLPRVNVNGWSRQDIIDYERRTNFLDANAVVRVSAIREVGGFPEDYDFESGNFGDTICSWDDWALWLKMAEAGKKFHCIPTVCWHYRPDAKYR